MADTVTMKSWPLAGYAPGNYTCTCLVCQKQFEGDKRAFNCLECAAALVNAHIAGMSEGARRTAPAEPVAGQDIDAQALDLTKRIEREFYHDHPGGSVQVRAKVQLIIRSALASHTVSDEMVERAARSMADGLEGPYPDKDAWIEYQGVARCALFAALGGHHD